METKTRVRIKKGWNDAGMMGTVLADSVFCLQNWVPVLWDDQEDPDFIKESALEIVTPDMEKKPGKIDEILREMLNTGIPGTLKPNEYGWKKIKEAKIAIRDSVLKIVRDEVNLYVINEKITKLFEE